MRLRGLRRSILPSLPKFVRRSLVRKRRLVSARRVRKVLRLRLSNVASRGYGRTTPRYFIRRGRVSTAVHLLKSSKYTVL